MKKQLTPRDQKVIDGLLSGKTAKKALMDAGYSKETAESRAKQVIGKNRIQSSLEKAFKKAGLTQALKAKVHVDLLTAVKTVSAVSGKDAGAGTVDFVDVPDYQARAKGLDMAYKIDGDYAAEKVEHSGEVKQVVRIVKFSDSGN